MTKEPIKTKDVNIIEETITNLWQIQIQDAYENNYTEMTFVIPDVIAEALGWDDVLKVYAEIKEFFETEIGELFGKEGLVYVTVHKHGEEHNNFLFIDVEI